MSNLDIYNTIIGTPLDVNANIASHPEANIALELSKDGNYGIEVNFYEAEEALQYLRESGLHTPGFNTNY